MYNTTKDTTKHLVFTKGVKKSKELNFRAKKKVLNTFNFDK